MRFVPHDYQQHAIEHILNNRYCALFLDMGLGKTVATLSAVDTLLKTKEAKKVLVIAPKRVVEDTWPKEVQKWDHLSHLRVSVVTGTESQRKAALRANADIYAINRENVVWLVAQYNGGSPFDTVVIDELSSFKSSKAARFKALRSWRPHINRVIGLTGTPAPNGLLDLWPQIYLLDKGERLGKTVTSYRDRYFNPGKRNGHVIYEYNLRTEDPLIGSDIYEREIYEKIGDICISMKAEDYLTLPPLLDQDVTVTLPPDIMKQYLQFERDQVLQLAELDSISAVNAASLTGKLLQFANGAVYREDGSYYEVHRCKIDALADDLEAVQGQPFLLFYQYRHDLERILRDLKAFKPHKLQGTGDISDWNRGKISFLLAHAASAGHGLNMQDGGHNLGWFGGTWSLELYLQAIARLYRQGQTRPVVNRRYAAAGTMDIDVFQALQDKAVGQDALMFAVKARVKKYLG
jgi:SNF2 family DNA or RNA helicase